MQGVQRFMYKAITVHCVFLCELDIFVHGLEFAKIFLNNVE